MSNFITFGYIFSASFLTWLVLAIFFALAQNAPRLLFIIGHYITSIIATMIFFILLFKFFPTFNIFNTMISAMISFFIIELIVFTFFYKQELWFLNFLDWMVPVMIISTTIYFIGYYFKIGF